MTLSKRTRFEILRRDEFACRYCGAKAPSVELHVDHVLPRKYGGTDDAWNLTAACVDCNLGKSHVLPTEEVIEDVRRAQFYHLAGQGLPVDPCVHCNKPVYREPDDEWQEHPQCTPCNMAVCDAHEAGVRNGRKELTSGTHSHHQARLLPV